MKYKLFVLALLTASLLCAQETELPQLRLLEKPRLLGNEFVGSSHKDVNGRTAAALKIISDMDGFAYKANNGIIGLDHQPGVDIVYVTPDERILRVYKTGYGEFLIILLDEGVSLRERQVWELKITGDKKPVNVTILTEPADAEKYIDGELLGTERVFAIVPGHHTLKVRKEGYRSIERQIEVTESNVLFEGFTLQQIDVAPVIIQTEPDGADIYINGTLRGKSYWSDFLFPDSYELKLVKEGYLEHSQSITIKEDQQNQFTFPLTRNSAMMNITVQPDDAKLMINNRQYTPGAIELSPGNYSLSVMQSGYLTQTDEITLELGQTLTRSYALEKNVGILTLTTSPANATLTINKKDYGHQRTIELAPGSYRIEVTADGHFPISENITIIRGETLNRSFTLEQQTGELQFTVRPAETHIRMSQADGTTYKRWQGLSLEKNIPVGKYTLEAVSTGYLPSKETVSIAHNKRQQVSMTLMTYEGSIQQEIDRQKQWRNYNALGSLALGLVAGALEYQSLRLYDDHKTARTTLDAQDLIDRSNTLHRYSGYLGAVAGASALPLFYWQFNIHQGYTKLKGVKR
jgi:hypothetical protein